MAAEQAELLRAAREQRGWSRQRLAELAGVSEDSVASYESGRRHPRRATLLRLADALQLDEARTSTLLAAAGFDPEPRGALARVAARRLPMSALAAELAAYPWPCLVMNERYEIIAWNQAANRVAELDFARDLPTPFERNLLRIAAMPHFFSGRVVNWDEIIGVLIGLYKHNQVNIAQPEEESQYLAHLIHEIQTTFSAAWPRLIGLWLAAVPYEEGRRVTFPAIWRLSDDTTLRFNCILYPWNDFDAAWAFDWFPADVTTWEWLGEHVPGPPVAAPAAPHAGALGGDTSGDAAMPLDSSRWHELLRMARDSTSLSREAVQRLSGVSKNTVDKYERGARRPTRETLLRLTRAMDVDTATTNAILTRAGFDPVPSDWARILAGLPRQTTAKWYGHEGQISRSWDQIQQDIDRYAWPCLVLNERCELVAHNPRAARVLDRDGQRDTPLPVPRNIVAFAVSAFARAHILNWEEVVTAIVPGGLRAAVAGTSTSRVPAPVQAVVAELRRQDAAVMDRLAALWRDAPRPVLASRIAFPLVWRTHDGEALAFHVVISWLNYNTAWALDWHPADASTWAWLFERG